MNFSPIFFFKKTEKQCIKCLKIKNIFNFKKKGCFKTNVSSVCKICEEENRAGN